MNNTRKLISLGNTHQTSKRYNARSAVTVFSDEESELKKSLRQFSLEVIAPKVAEMDNKAKLDPEVLKKCFEKGIMGIETPKSLSGSGMSFVSSCIVIEELARVDPSVSVVVDVQNTLLNTAIRKWGNEEQKKKYLPRLATDTLGSFCLTEWGSGSDAFAMKSTAVKKGDQWVLNGTKAWITNADEAGLFLVMANAEPAKGYKGITSFLVSRDNPGLTVGKKEDKLGIRASSTCEVQIQDCVVHEKDVLGPLGSGYKIAIESLNEGRIGIGAQMLGLARGAFEQTVSYLKQKPETIQRTDVLVSPSDQGMHFEIARLALQIEAAKLLVYNAARLQEMGKPFRQEASYAKLYSSQVAEIVSSKCIELLGEAGLKAGSPFEKFYRDCKIGQIYEGTTNIQLQTIAKDVFSKDPSEL